MAPRQSRKRRRGALLAGAISLLAAGGAAAADPEPPGPAAAPMPVPLETVMVTAQKRSEDIKEVPLSVTALSAAELKDEHLTDITDLARAVPSLAFSNQGGAGLNRIELRGVSSDGGSPTVGVYLDDVPIIMPNIPNTGATEPRFFDIDRIEVLRGPQGTLFGASSLGGTIRFISKQPDLDQVSGTADSQISGTEHGGVNFEESGVLNVPLSPGVAALRVGLDYGQQSGFIDHLATPDWPAQDGTNLETDFVARASLKLKPSDDLVILPAFLFQRVRSDDTDVYDLSLPPLEQQKLVAERGRDTLFVPSITVEKDFGWADLTSISSYYWRQFDRIQDGTFYNSILLAQTLQEVYGTYYQAIANIPSPAYIYPKTNQYSQELRLSSKSEAESGEPYAWQVGLFVSDQHLNLSDQEYMPGLSKLIPTLFGGQSATQILGVPFYPIDSVFWNVDRHDERQYAVFGEANYNPLPALKLTVGLRYLYARDTDGGTEGAYYSIGIPPVYATVARSYALTPKFAATYDLTDTATVYANASKGFRLGAGNFPIPQFECEGDLQALGLSGAPAFYHPDSLWSYEAGTKSSLLDNRLSVDFSVFYIDWKHVQQQIPLPTCGFDFVENAGDAESYGTEVELHAKLTDELTLSVASGYSHATLTSVTPGSGATVGQKLIGTPDWTSDFGLEYARSVTDTIDGFVRADWDWVGRSHGAFDPTDPDYSRPVYDVVNASIGVDIDTVEVSLFAKNLFDQQKTIQRPSLLSVSEGYTVRPLTVGLEVSTSF